MPTISVIIPAYNCGLYIEEAIESVLAQTCSDFEIILVDDGSTDDTLQVAGRMARADNRIKIIKGKHSGKPSVARNAGIRHSSGEFLCFLDGDDTIFPDKLEKQLRLLRQYPQVDLAFHDVRPLFEHNRPDEKSHLEKVDFVHVAKDYVSPAGKDVYLCHDNYYNFMSAFFASILVCSVMVRRSCIYAQDVWFPEDMAIGEDIDLWFRLARTRRFVYLNETLSYYRQHETSITHDLGRYLKGSIAVHCKNLERGTGILTPFERKKYETKIRALHWHYGYLLFCNYDMSGARREFAHALRLEFSTKALIALLKTLVPTAFIKYYKSRVRASL